MHSLPQGDGILQPTVARYSKEALRAGLVPIQTLGLPAVTLSDGVSRRVAVAVRLVGRVVVLLVNSHGAVDFPAGPRSREEGYKTLRLSVRN